VVAAIEQRSAAMSAREYQGKLVPPKGRFAVIVSRFNEFVTSKLLDGAMDAFTRHGVEAADVEVVWSPGSFEIPLLAQRLASGGRYLAVVCLGAVIRGGTDHYQYVAAEVAKGIAAASLNTGVPCIFGVLTCDTVEQAVDRAGTKGGNKGADAAMAAIEMANLLGELPPAPPRPGRSGKS
jgi:6,7-dimethyl-8-ribityllumazine synthase